MQNQNKSQPLFTVQTTTWQASQTALKTIREQVFINEQLVPVELEWDEQDASAIHLLATGSESKPIGCARVLENGSIGRMAVLTGWRNLGIGKALLSTAINVCREHQYSTVTLSAQTHAIGFYEKAGFTICSKVYLDAGIPHRDMGLKLDS
ncbi:GNAT family N-acetyltransferase [Methyloradius palustris]|uniref:GNAT family N-acetyltransferase n=1 Tax=Methyloradius palustris TaxID=2778876 RepID=A0A8D5K1X3_9PROT|nr:GNAT family N-acetyltransferase [Methyloradius palustris]BCM26158.1 GNAT family N-acetyltransferase [Methyloradius palustris]